MGKSDSILQTKEFVMSDLFLLSDRQLSLIEPYFPLPHGVPRTDDRRVLSGIIHVIKNGLRWRDAPTDYGPYKTLYNRFVRWSRLGVFDRIFCALAGKNTPATLQIDATHIKAHRIACSLAKRGAEFQTARCRQRCRKAHHHGADCRAGFRPYRREDSLSCLA